MQRAWERIAAVPTGTLQTHLGTVDTPNGEMGCRS
jgi:hypothetical protein